MNREEELEIKLEVPAAALQAVEDWPLLRGVVPSSKVLHLTSVYYDTDARDLKRHGVSLRVRSDGLRYVQTIKTDAAGAAGWFQRGEWEREVSEAAPDFAAAKNTPLEALLSKRLRRALKPVFETHVDRKVFPLRQDDAAVEVAVDQGEITDGRQSARIAEVELELKEGDRPDRLFELAGEVAATALASLGVRSKAERGYALVDGTEGQPERAAKVRLAKHASAADAFRAVAHSCLRQIAANRGAVERDDPEGVHQMRVGLRRLRAVISLFGDILGSRDVARMKTNLKWLTNELAPARQVHVFEQRVMKSLRRADLAKSKLAALSEDIARRRTAASVRAKTAIASDRYRRMLLDLAEWIDAGAWLSTHDGPAADARRRPADQFAREVLDRRTHRLVQRGDGLREMDNRERHKFRIDAKKLRYASESFASLFGGGRARPRRRTFVTALRRLQDDLGSLNDIVANEALSDEIARDAASLKGRRQLQFVAGLAAGYEESRRERLLQNSVKRWRRFAKAPRFWR